MLSCVDQSTAAAVEIFFDFDGHWRGLARSQIITPDVSGLLKHDRLFTHRWELDVEIREVRQLLCFLRRKIQNEEVHPAVPVRNEIDFVVWPPHWADVLRGIVRWVFRCTGF